MSWNGSGLFKIDSTGQPVSANTLIESADFNALTADLATGLSNCITKDGQQTVTANLPMATYRHTGVGNAVARTDYAAAGQVQDGKLNWVDGGGTADAITATYSPAITELVDGQMCCVRATAANATTTPTFSPNGLTARTIVKKGGSALAVGDISADGHELILRYDLTNTQWELLNPAPASLAANTFTGLQQLDYSTDIASAATVDLGTATGNSVTVTHSSGTTAITSFGGAATVQKGTIIAVIPSISGGTLTVTHHATNLILLGGTNITLASGDVLLMMKNHDSNAEWKHVGGWKAGGTAWVVASSSSFPAGTLMLFQQTAAPTGWTKETTHNDKALRVVSGTVSSGGSSAFSTVFGKTGTDAHTLTTAQIPAQTYQLAGNTSAGGGNPRNGTTGVSSALNDGASSVTFGSIPQTTANGSFRDTNTGGSHTHNMDIQVQYVDLIIASKDA